MMLSLKYSFFLMLIIPAIQPSYGQVPEKQVVKEAEKIFDAEINIGQLELAPGWTREEQADTNAGPATLVQPADELYALYSEGKEEPRGYCFASSAKGRFENFEYFILYDTAFVVQSVKVWKYRSSYGGAVAGKRWLRQFSGYRKGELTYGRDVQAISGATISGNALVDEVVRAGRIMDQVVR